MRAYKGANVGSGLGENTGAAVEVGITVTGVGGGPGLVEVIENDIGVVDDQISVEMVNKVVANGQVDPRLLGNEGLLILGASNNLKLISRANTTYHAR